MPSALEAPAAAKLAEVLEEYLAEHPAAALLEDGRVLFDMRRARSELPPRLLLAAAALRIHPANLPVLRYLSPAVTWELIASASTGARN